MDRRRFLATALIPLSASAAPRPERKRITLSPIPGQPVVVISYGSDSFNLTCAEAFGIGTAGHHQTTDGIHYAGTGSWIRNGNAVTHTRVISAAPAINYTVIIVADDDDTLELTFSVTNKSASAFASPSWADWCFQYINTPSLVDPDGSQTYMPWSQGGGCSMAAADGISSASQAGGGTLHLHAPHVGLASNRQTCGSAVVRRNAASTRFSGFSFKDSPTLFVNQGQGNCIHSAPPITPKNVALQPNSGFVARGRIVLDQPDLNSVLTKLHVG